MTILLIKFAASALVIVIAGIVLARSSDRIAEITGLGRLLVGGIFLAAATSLPELFVDLNAVRNGMPNIAVGDLMGSSLFNLLILAVADLLHKSSKSVFSRVAAGEALAALVSINLTALAALSIFLSAKLPNTTIGGIGPGPILLMFSYVLGLRLIYNEQQIGVKKEHLESTAKANANASRLKRDTVYAVSGYIFAATALLLAAPYMTSAAGELAEVTGLGKTFIGTTLVGFCTSLPELVSTITAVRIGAFDLAVGSILGSNAFNMTLFLPLDAVFRGSLMASVSPTHAYTGLAVIIATSIIVMGQLYQLERRRKIIEPDAFAVIAVVLGFLAIFYFVGDTGLTH